MRCTKSSRATVRPTKARCSTSPARCFTSMPRSTTRSRASAAPTSEDDDTDRRRIAQGARRPDPRGDRQFRRRAPGLRRLRRNQLGPFAADRRAAPARRSRRRAAHPRTAAAGRVPRRRPPDTRRTNCSRASACRTASSSTRSPTRSPRSSTTSKRCATSARTATASSTSRARAWKRCATGRCRRRTRRRRNAEATVDIGATPSTTSVDVDRLRTDAARRAAAGPTRSSPSRRMPVAEAPVAAPAPVATGAAGGFEATSDEIDDEIREVFLEEFEEEIGHLEQMLPAVARRAGRHREAAPDPPRVPHAEGQRPPRRRQDARRVQLEDREHAQPRARRHASAESDAVIALVDQAFYTLPHLHAALRGEAPLTADLAGIEAIAERVAAGEEVDVRRRRAAPSLPKWPRRSPKPTVEATSSKSLRPPSSTDEEPTIAAKVDPVLLEILGTEVGGHLDHHRCVARAGAGAPDRRQRRAAARDAHDERCVRDDRSAGHHQRHRPGRDLHQAHARRARAADGAGRRRAGRDRRGDPPHGRCVAVRRRRACRCSNRSRARSPNCATRCPKRRCRCCRPNRSSWKRPNSRAASTCRSSPTSPTKRRSTPGCSCRTKAPTVPRPTTSLVSEDLSDVPRPRRRDPGRCRPADSRRRRRDRRASSMEEIVLDGEVATPSHDEIRAEMRVRRSVDRRDLDGDAGDRRDLDGVDLARVRRRLRQPASMRRPRLEARCSKPSAWKPNAWKPNSACRRWKAERLEAERIAYERDEAERAEAERVEAERVEAERVEAERARSRTRRSRTRRSRTRRSRTRSKPNALEAERARSRTRRSRTPRSRTPRSRTRSKPNASKPNASKPNASKPNASKPNALEAERVEAERASKPNASLPRKKPNTRASKPKKRPQRQARERAAAEAAQPIAPVEAPAVERRTGSEPAVAQMLADAMAGHGDPDEALDLTDLDPELVDIFFEEGGDLLDHSDGLLAQLRDGPTNANTWSACSATCTRSRAVRAWPASWPWANSATRWNRCSKRWSNIAASSVATASRCSNAASTACTRWSPASPNAARSRCRMR